MRRTIDGLIAVVAVLAFVGMARGQGLEIKGAGVRTVIVVESLPFTIQAPNEAPKGSAIFGHQWEYKRDTVTATARDSVLEVTAASKGTLVVFCAWWVVDFGAQKVERKTAFVTFAIGEIGPAPAPPVDPLPPVRIAKHISFVGANAATATVAVDAGLHAWLKSVGVTVHQYKAEDAADLAAAVAKAGGVPCFIIQDVDGRVVDQAKIISVTDVKALVGKYVK